MICKHSDSGIYFIYKFVDKNTVEISNGDFSKNISYENWINDFFIIDKWRDILRDYEITNVSEIKVD